VRQRWSEMSERKSEDREEVEQLEERREKGLRLMVRVGICVRKRPRSRLQRMMLSNRMMEARVGVIPAEEEVDIEAGVVRSRSEMNSLKAVRVISPAILKGGKSNAYPASPVVQRYSRSVRVADFSEIHSC
jgi:hypothetical protein